ncbi:MAG: DMT family transporter [Burkholderiaceae bacterium]
MNQRLTPATAALLTIPPLLWAGNAIVGRLVAGQVPPLTLNWLRWLLALALLLPLGWRILRPDSGLWPHWRRYAVLGLLGVGLYNSFQYLALQTSTPINVTLVAASLPIWMMAVGRLFFGAAVTRRQIGGAVLSMVGVACVWSHGEWSRLLALRLVPGDIFVLLATVAWSFYSWLLMRTSEPAGIRQDWAGFLLAQIAFGLVWSGAFAAGESHWSSAVLHWTPGVVAALVYVAVFPAIVAYRCWALGVERVGPNVAGFFNNLTPLFAALMSAAFLGEPPQLYHAIAFLLIVGGIVVSSRRSS